MTKQAEDRENPRHPALEGVPFSDIGNATELAPETPLTREAAIHLRAAGMEIDRAFADVGAILRTVKNEVHPWTLGAGVTLDEGRADDLSRLLRQAIDMAERKMVRPVFERGRGERPHGSGPSVTFSGDRLRNLLEAMAATHEVVALLSDGEYENVHGGRGAAKKAYHLLSPFTEQVRDALGIDEQEEYEIADQILEDVSDFEEAS